MGTLVEMSTTEGWVDVMYQAIDATAIDQNPVRDFAVSRVWFFMAFIVVGHMFVLNLLVGAIIDNFNRLKEELGGSAFLTETYTLANAYVAWDGWSGQMGLEWSVDIWR